MDIAHDLGGLSYEQFNKATAIAAQFLTDPIGESLRHPKVPDVMEFCRVVRETALSSLFSDIKTSRQHPRSMQHFLSLASPIFSEQHLEFLSSQATRFETISGVPCISDRFISSRPAIDSIKDVIWAIVSYSATTASDTTTNQPTTTATEVTQAQPAAVPPPGETRSQSSSQSVASEVSDLRLPTGSGRRPCQIIQIELNGPTIAEAWRKDTRTNAMENLARGVDNNADPSSMTFRALPVYHGTNWGIEDNENTRDDLERDYLQPFVSRNQVVPTSGSVLPVVWTGFSPLRCFLWAAFKAEVLHQIPIGSVQHGLRRSWSHSEHAHSGVVLFEFRPSLPSAFGQTYYVMPRGKEAEWEDICEKYNTGGFVSATRGLSHIQHLWDRFSSIHHRELNSWPNALHCHEFGARENTAQALTTQLWRTAWFDEGVEALNNSHTATYAISFKQSAPLLPNISLKRRVSSDIPCASREDCEKRSARSSPRPNRRATFGVRWREVREVLVGAYRFTTAATACGVSP